MPHSSRKKRRSLTRRITPTFVLARAISLLAPPQGVTLQFANGVLSATGAAPTQWIVEARKLARAIPGVTELNDRELLDTDAQARALKLKELQAAQAAIEQVVRHFPVDSIDLERGQEEMLTHLVATVQTLWKAARFVGYDLQIDAIGRADRTGIAKKNAVLRQQRAERVIAELATRGLLSKQLAMFRPRAGEPRHEGHTSQELEADRSVIFAVRVADRQKKLE